MIGISSREYQPLFAELVNRLPSTGQTPESIHDQPLRERGKSYVRNIRWLLSDMLHAFCKHPDVMSIF
jgi:hypothetical protein